MKKVNRRKIDVLNKKGISVLAIGIVLFSVLVSAIPVMAAGEITAMRDISNQAVNPGDTFTVTVTITANQEIEALALDEDIPSGWEVTRVSDDAAAFKESTIEWIWTEKLSAGDSKTVVYNVTVPSNAESGTYYITGKVSAYNVNPIAVGGETEVNVTGNLPPIANFTYLPPNPVVNQPVTFNASPSYDPDGFIANYEWDFGDGNTATGKIVTHSYSSEGEYRVKLTVTDDSSLTNSTTRKIKVENELPSQLKELWHSKVSGNVKDVFSADLDNDGEKEVIAGTDENKIYVFDSKGNKKWEYTAGSAVMAVCAADFNGDGKKEVVAGTDYKDLGNIYTFDSSGNLLWKFQTGAKHYWPDNKLNVRVITAGDVDNDGKEEIVVGSTHYYWFPGRVCILGEGGNLEGEYWNPGHVYSIQIGDIDNDGDSEIVIGFVNNDYGYEGAIALFNGNDVSGEAPAAVNGYDYNAGSQIWYWHSGVDHSNIFSVFPFDLDGDGINEIIAGSDDNNVYTLDSNGNVKWKYGTKGRIGEESILASDLNNDGKGEVIAGSYDNNAYCIDYEGNLKWKYETIDPVKIPFAGDVDNDGMGEVVAVSDKVYVLTSDGKVKYDYPRDGVAYVADLGEDNVKEIVLGSGTTVYALAINNLSVIFEDDFSELNLNTWIPFGSPSPRVLASVEGRNGVFDNNGDSWCNSGVVSKKNFSFPNGFTMESDMFLRVTDVTGCWDDAIIGITRQNTPTGESPCPTESYPLGVYTGIFYTGDACWATPVEKRRHAYFRAALYAEDGTSESVGYNLSADDYINGWHSYKIVVGSDRYVKFYVDGDLIYASKKKLHPDVLNKKKIFLGVRSSGSAGKSYHDFIKVYAPSSNISTVSFNPPKIKIPPNSTNTINITLDSAPNGLSGYNLTVSLSNPEVAEIVSVSFPEWATLHSNSPLPADSVWMKCADLNDEIKSGDKNISLARLTLRGDEKGKTDLVITVTKIDDDDGNPIDVSTTKGYLEVARTAMEEPSVFISTDKYEYTAGDVMLINITITNPGEREGVKFLWCLDILDYDKHFIIINNRSLLLSPHYDKTFTLRWKLPKLKSSFNASWHVAIFNKTTSELISEDLADWKYVAEKAMKMTSKDVKVKVRRIQLQKK
ncbi:MAG: PKD domain-containing protein [Canidatus Methanoxibalbensis ujae]|nr:PKD domain-containing protein [Candidatus Methanoxibalbensis ujae]